MRKYIILIISVLCLFISSNVNAENIAGFPFGEKFESFQKYSEVTNKSLPHEYEVDDVKFFDKAQVGTDTDKIIRSLIFQKKYTLTTLNLQVTKTKILDDFKNILKAIEKKYGEFDKTKAKRLLGRLGTTNLFYMGAIEESVSNINPKSNKVGSILFMLSSPDDKNFILGSEKKVTLNLIYIDPALAEQLKQTKETEFSSF